MFWPLEKTLARILSSSPHSTPRQKRKKKKKSSMEALAVLNNLMRSINQPVFWVAVTMCPTATVLRQTWGTSRAKSQSSQWRVSGPLMGQAACRK